MGDIDPFYDLGGRFAETQRFRRRKLRSARIGECFCGYPMGGRNAFPVKAWPAEKRVTWRLETVEISLGPGVDPAGSERMTLPAAWGQ
ncbi:hypothetical protein M8818_007440 [Zalaria obscura]|uniref:Uncharacterized protein n=1 Tax=Zalaria obscura TaxID=2024903 RepID=A0ACC3S3Z7_9PEZI